VTNSDLIPEAVANSIENEPVAAEGVKSARRKFVVPEVSVPFDVLEATTFFQAVDSGATN